MRLDKFLSETGTATRTESKKAARSGGIAVNGVTVKDPSMHIVMTGWTYPKELEPYVDSVTTITTEEIRKDTKE